MRVFVTGAAGFIGIPTVKELISSGHEVLGLARSDEGAKSLAELGAKVQRGSLEDTDGLKKAPPLWMASFISALSTIFQNSSKTARYSGAFVAIKNILATGDSLR
jgi:nucleoside-diphosphate-sugar epimerase